MFKKLQNMLIGKALEQCSDPFEEGRVIVMMNFCLFLFLSNIIYTIIAFNYHISLFVSAIVADIVFLTIIILLNRGYKVQWAINIFFVNFVLQHLYHFTINNGALVEQGVLFYLLTILFALVLYGQRMGWIIFLFTMALVSIGIYNQSTNLSLFEVPSYLADPPSEGNEQFLVILPVLMNVYLISEFVKAQRKAKKQIFDQKQQLTIKNKEITDSINYAKRIQEAILPSKKSFHNDLPDSFIFYKPKDIVAGDFYWMEHYNGKIFVAAADCTGHGVPGAMVSVICSNALTKAVLEEGITETGKILDQTRELVIEKLSKGDDEKNHKVQDGMDISLAAIDFSNNKMMWSGANNPLYLVRNGAKEIEVLKGDRQPIGNYYKTQNFTTHYIDLKKGDSFYLFTDGFADQFGGPDGRKYSYKRFKKMIMDVHAQPINEQNNLLEKEFNSWITQAKEEQLDDACIIGIRV